MSTALGDFVTLRLIRGYALGPLEASPLGGKTPSPYDKVRRRRRRRNFICQVQIHSWRYSGRLPEKANASVLYEYQFGL